jgi:hypothetical protein
VERREREKERAVHPAARPTRRASSAPTAPIVPSPQATGRSLRAQSAGESGSTIRSSR